MDAKIYVGNAQLKKDKFQNEFMLFKLGAKDVETIKVALSDNMSKGGNNVTIGIVRRKEASKYGNTHYGVVFPFKKFEGGQGGNQGNSASQTSQGQGTYSGGNKASSTSQGNSGNNGGHRYGKEDLPDIPFQ